MPQGTRHGRTLLAWLAVFVVIGGLAAAYFWRNSLPQPQAAKPAPSQRKSSVLAAPAKKEDVNVYLSGLGSVTALQTVTLRSRVDGELMEALFKEGQMVRQGELLARIDPRPFETQLAQAEGQMARDRAFLENTRLDLNRLKPLMDQKVIAKQQIDTQESLVRQYEGAVQADQAQINSAKLQLTYSRITAPISGRVGLRLVDPGNMVRQNDASGLLVITQVQPIAVLFTIPEDQLPQVLEQMRAGLPMPVDAYDREQKRKLATGVLASLDNQIDASTGTVKLKAVFANDSDELFPNQFVNAKLLVRVLRGAVVAPQTAIQRGQQGPYVFVVKEDRTVALRPVALGETAGATVVIQSGLEAGELVVVDGADRLRDGAQVELREAKGQGGPGKPDKSGKAGKPDASPGAAKDSS